LVEEPIVSSPSPVRQLIVLAHPSTDSFCAEVARHWQARARKNYQICELRDLYADGFDPVLKATEQAGKRGYAPLAENLEECRALQGLNVLVFVYPIWFGTPPAMLKGYLERVIGSSISFSADREGERPLSNVRLVQLVTSATSNTWLAEKGVRGALHTLYNQYISEVFGAKEIYRLHLDSITQDISPLHASMRLTKVDELADQVCAAANADRWDRERSAMTKS
jgi:NAD(P)H dehydrogenase (quinone)